MKRVPPTLPYTTRKGIPQGVTMSRDPRKVAEKQIRRAQEASQDYVDGIKGVTEAPGLKAVKKKDKMKANFLKSLDDGKYERNTAAVSLQDWQAAAETKGAPRYSSGVEAARNDIIAFQEEFQPFVDGVKRELDAMPDATPEQRKAKMLANFEKMSKFRRTKRRR